MRCNIIISDIVIGQRITKEFKCPVSFLRHMVISPKG